MQRTMVENMNTMTYLFVQAIDPARLDQVRITGADGHGNRLRPFAATGKAALALIIERLLREPDVATAHVRALAPQCFLYAVTAG
jgi:hypothetical protein